VTSDEIVLRPAGEGDRERRAAFACSTGAWFEDDVERYVRHHHIGVARLHFLAVALTDQGRMLDSGRRLSDALLE